MKKNGILQKIFTLGIFFSLSLLGSNIAYADELTLKAYPIVSEGFTTVGDESVYNAIAFVDGTEEKTYYDSIGIDKLWFNTKEGGFGSYTPQEKTHSPLWKMNPGIIYQNTQIGKSSFVDNSGTQVGRYRTLKGGRVDPNDQSLGSYRAGEGTSLILSEPFSGANNLIGQRLEFRFMGYTENGTIISNPYFPADNPTNTTNAQYSWDPSANLSAFGFERSELDFDKERKTSWINKYLLQNCVTGEVSDLASKGDANYWIDKFIVAGNPGITTGIWIGSRGGGTGYRTVTTVSTPKPNLRTSWLEISDSSGKVLGTAFSRYGNNGTTFIEENGKDMAAYVEKDENGNEIGLNRGETYHAQVIVKNMYPPDHATSLYLAEGTQIQRYGYYGESTPFVLDTEYSNSNNNDTINYDYLIDKDKELYSQHIGSGATVTFEYDFTVPVDANGYYKESVNLPKGHAIVQNGDPSSGHDDFSNSDNEAYLIYKINPNDLTITDIQFVDEDGMPTSEPDPNKEYKVQYVVQYNGGDMPYEVPISIKDIAVTSKGGTLYSRPGTVITKNVQLKQGESTVLETDYMEITEPYIKAIGTVSSDKTWNEDEGKSVHNNTMEKAIQGTDWNLKLKITGIDPQKAKVGTSGKKQSFVVNYQVTLETPTSITEQSLDTSVVLNMSSTGAGTLRGATDEISIEKGVNDLSFVVDDIDLSSGNYDLNWDLEVNPTRTEPGYEKRWDDNKDSYKSQVVLDNGSPCTRTSKHTYHSWTQTFKLRTWTGKSCNKHGCHKKNKTKYEYVNMYEDYKITKIDFKSKLENDTKGEGAVVDLMTNAGKIKAGYGFNLDIEYIYKTNRKIDQPREWSSCSSGQKITATKISSVTVPTKIFVVLPDGQVISNTTERGAANLLNCTASGSWDNRTVKCSVKEGNTFNVKTTSKLYIDENTKDGDYNMTVCTEEFSGVPGKTNTSFPDLYDRYDTTITVTGSYKDDIKLHIR